MTTRQLTPLLASQTASPSTIPTGDPPPEPQQKNAPPSTEKKKSFWTQPGISTFVDWITNPENYERLYKPKAISGEKNGDILKEIAEHVNSKGNTAWTGDTVKQKISYAKSQYIKAFQLTRKTGEGDGGGEDSLSLQARKLELCPFFDRFHAVYSSNSLIANPPPPRQYGSYPGERVIVESSPETSNLEDYSDQDDDDGDHGGMLLSFIRSYSGLT